MLIVASWVHRNRILPLATFKRTGLLAWLQKRLAKQSLLNGAHLCTGIHQYIRNHSFLSISYSHFQVQLPFVSMWSMDNSHGMQL